MVPAQSAVRPLACSSAAPLIVIWPCGPCCPFSQAGCLAGQVVARWRCGRKRRSMGLDDGSSQCDTGSRRNSLEVAPQRRFGRVMA